MDRQHHRRPLRRPAVRARHRVAAAPSLDQHPDAPAADRPPGYRRAAPRCDRRQATRRPRRRTKPAQSGRLCAVGGGSLTAIVRQGLVDVSARACAHVIMPRAARMDRPPGALIFCSTARQRRGVSGLGSRKNNLSHGEGDTVTRRRRCGLEARSSKLEARSWASRPLQLAQVILARALTPTSRRAD